MQRYVSAVHVVNVIVYLKLSESIRPYPPFLTTHLLGALFIILLIITTTWLLHDNTFFTAQGMDHEYIVCPLTAYIALTDSNNFKVSYYSILAYNP